MWIHEIYGERILETDLDKALVEMAEYVRKHPSDKPLYALGKIRAVFQNALTRDPPSERHGGIHVDAPR